MKNSKRILIACEESQEICKAFRNLGFEAYSCDLKECSGKHPEWHIVGDIFEVIKTQKKFDLMIAHPPCTYLAVSGARWMYNKDKTINIDRLNNQNNALDFVQKLMNLDIKHIAIENPVSVISSRIKKPSQCIQPWQYGHKAQKKTCLWLKNLPLLIPTNIVEKGDFLTWICSKTGKIKRQSKWDTDIFRTSKTPESIKVSRSKTFEGIAQAMAKQWGDFIKNA